MKKNLIPYISKTAVAVLLLTVSSLLLVSCASNKITSRWHDTALPEITLQDVLVVAVARNDNAVKDVSRKIFEDSFVANLQKEDITAFSMLSVSKADVTYESIAQAVQQAGAKTVILTRITRATEKSRTTDAVDRFGNLQDTPIISAILDPVPTVSTNVKTVLQYESRLFDVATKELLWSAVITSPNPVLTRDYMDSLTRTIIKEIKN